MTRRWVLISRRFWPLVGGAEAVMAQLSAELAAEGDQVRLLTARWSPDWPRELVQRGVPVIRLAQPRIRWWGTWRYCRNLERWLVEHSREVDLAYVSMLKHDAYAALGAGHRAGFPVVLRAEGAGVSGDVHWQLAATGGRHIKRRCQGAAALVAPSRAIEQELIAAGYPRARIHYLPNGVRIPPPRDPAARQTARATLAQIHPGLALAPGTPLAVFTGRLHPGKGLWDLLAAWPAVDARRPEARLWLVGDGPQAAELAQRIEAAGLAGKVVLTGSFDQVDDVLAAADLFVLPSHEEGMSLALLEALAAGLPSVACDIPGNRPLIEHGRQGWLVPPGQPAGLAAGIEHALAQPAEARAWGEAARQRVSAEFSLAETVRRHRELFEQVLAQRRSPTR